VLRRVRVRDGRDDVRPVGLGVLLLLLLLVGGGAAVLSVGARLAVRLLKEKENTR
jgi:hypothetical protein